MIQQQVLRVPDVVAERKNQHRHDGSREGRVDDEFEQHLLVVVAILLCSSPREF